MGASNTKNYQMLESNLFSKIFKNNENKAKVSLQTVDNYSMGASNIETSLKNKSKKIVFFAKVLVICVDNYSMGTSIIRKVSDKL